MDSTTAANTEESAGSAVCPVCGGCGVYRLEGGDQTYKVTPYIAKLYCCGRCGVDFQWPMPSRNVIASFYPKGYWLESLKTSPLAKLMALYVRLMLRFDILAWFKKMKLKPEESYLDMGCSRGDFLALAKQTGVKAEGIEGDPNAAAFARKTFGLVVHELDLDTWQPEPNSWNGLSLFHVLEHVREPQELLNVCFHALKPGGKLLLRVPNIGSWQSRLFGHSWKPLDLPRHLTHFHPKALKQVLERNGFQIQALSTWSLRDGAPAWSASLFQSGEPTYQQIHQKHSTWRIGVFFVLTWVLTPLECLAAFFGRGGMITVLAQKPDH